MADIVFGGALSHSPLMNFPFAKNHDQVERFRSATKQLANNLRRARPDALVVVGPDHFRTLFYDLMPAFVVGTGRVRGWGDWNTPEGPFETLPELARHIGSSLLEAGFDAALSEELTVDHGITQPLQLLQVEDLPIIPVIINAAGPPLPTASRCHAFGRAIGSAIRNFSGLRVAILASGGLSHDPPAPSPENALHGRTNGFAASRDRETRLMEHAHTMESRINELWDRRFLQSMAQGEIAQLAAQWTTPSIHEAAGNGGQEVRTWIALAGALGDPQLNVLCYEPIDALITGMGVVSV